MNENTTSWEDKALDEVTVAFNELADAAKTLDHERYFSFFDKQRFTSLNDDGSVLHDFIGFEAMYMSYVPAIEKYNHLSFENVKVTTLTPEVCLLVNEYSAEIQLTSGDTIRTAGAGTQVWHNNAGSWLLVHVSSSTKPSE